MKSITILLVSIIFFSACSKNESTPTTVAVLTNADSALVGSNTTILATGNFINGGGYSVSGKASWHKATSTQTLLLSNFSSSGGPDLKVYLSKDLAASSFILLGDLKSTSGNQTYAIPNSASTADYKFVLIYCQRFSALFGSANIK